MDLMLAKAKPVSDSGSASVVTYLRRGRKNCSETTVEREERDDVKEKTLQTPRSVKKEGEEVLKVPEHLVMKTMVRQAVPLQFMEVHGGADLHLQPMEGTPRQSRWMPEGSCDPAVSPRWSRLLPGPADRGERSPHWSRFAGRACDPMGNPHWSSLFLKDCTPWEGPTLGQFVKSCSLWEGLMLEKFVENCLP